MTAPPAFKRSATIHRLPPEHQRQARARIVVWRLLRTAKPAPRHKRAHPGGWFAPRDRKDDPR